MAMSSKPPTGGIAGLKITIVGLGLMGGSIAKALRRQGGVEVTAVERDEGLLTRALAEGVISHGTLDAAEGLQNADLTVVCLYPADTIAFITENMTSFKAGSVLTDICGVKQTVIEAVLPGLRADLDFVPAHPMAGRERGGYAYSTEGLFDGCNFIITPLACNAPQSVELVRRFAGALGAGAIVQAEAAEHDALIAYTSQLPHALAVTYVLCADGRDPLPFSAGSYRDVSRVAAINAAMWSELFLCNKDALLRETRSLKARLEELEQMLTNDDKQAIMDSMARAARAREAGL